MKPFISIITPTLQRQSLIQTCASVDRQRFTRWEHIVQVDCKNLDAALINSIESPQRSVYRCDVPHKNYGNTCRHLAWEMAVGDWILYLDDDNFLSDKDVLTRIYSHIMGPLFTPPKWAIFPIVRHGQWFFNDPPALCMTDTANVVVQREVGRWPDIPDYTADGQWVEGLKQYPWLAFQYAEPIVVMPKSNEGK